MRADDVQLNPMLRLAFTRLRRSSFVRNVLTVMSGTAFAQAIGFALSPAISRLFSPADFGVFGSFNAVLAVVTAGVTLGYAQAIVPPKENPDAMNLFALSCISTVLVGFGCLATWYVVPSFSQELLESSSGWLPGLLVLAVVIGGLNQASQAWCIRVKSFKRTSASQAMRSVAANGMQVGLGCLKAGAPGLIISSVLADILASLNLLWRVIPDIRMTWNSIQWRRMVHLAKEYRDFPAYGCSQNVVNALSRGLPVLLLAHFYGLGVAGAFAFGSRILSAPMQLVLSSLWQVLYQKAAETQNRGGALYPLYLKTVLALFVCAFIPTVIFMIWSPKLFAFIFGSRWLEAGIYARYLLLWLLPSFCSAPATAFARLVRVQHVMFAINLAMLVGRMLALIGGGLYLTALGSIVLFSLVGLVMNTVLILAVGRSVKKKTIFPQAA